MKNYSLKALAAIMLFTAVTVNAQSVSYTHLTLPTKVRV